MKKAGLLFMVALLALGMSLAGGTYAQGQKVVRITLIDQNGSGEDGSAQLTDLGDGTVRVELIMMNAPEGAVQPAHIHKGSCTTLDPSPAFPLTSVTGGKSTTVVTTTLAALTKEKYAINVHESATNPARYVSCGNLTSAATLGGPAPLDQAMTTLQDQANELAATLKNSEADASKSAFINFRSTFTQYKEQINGRNAAAGSEIETAMNAVNDAMGKGDFAGAATAAEKLASAVKDGMSSASSVAPAAAAPAAGMAEALKQLQSAAADVQKETMNGDKAGSQQAYDSFRTTFTANENTVKAQNPNAQARMDAAMTEVGDAVAAGDFKKANTAANELVSEVNDAMKEAGMTATTVANEAPTGANLPKGGSGEQALTLELLALAGIGLALCGLFITRKSER